NVSVLNYALSETHDSSMGKRKSKRKLKPKKKLVLETQFDCVICNHERSVD
ncbi:23970_t:CDS:2, partial [Entrophospora sp. SA101]